MPHPRSGRLSTTRGAAAWHKPSSRALLPFAPQRARSRRIQRWPSIGGSTSPHRNCPISVRSGPPHARKVLREKQAPPQSQIRPTIRRIRLEHSSVAQGSPPSPETSDAPRPPTSNESSGETFACGNTSLNVSLPHAVEEHVGVCDRSGEFVFGDTDRHVDIGGKFFEQRQMRRVRRARSQRV